jgi:hypothetical protein
MDDLEQTAEKTYRAIGRFVFEFSQAEYTIRHYLAEEIGLDEQHFTVVVESYDVGLLCNVATEVFAKGRLGRNAAQIKELINCFRSINDKRNRVAHGLWVPFQDGGTVHHVSRRRLTSERFENQAETLEKLADETSQLRAKLENAFVQVPFRPAGVIR